MLRSHVSVITAPLGIPAEHMRLPNLAAHNPNLHRLLNRLLNLELQPSSQRELRKPVS